MAVQLIQSRTHCRQFQKPITPFQSISVPIPSKTMERAFYAKNLKKIGKKKQKWQKSLCVLIFYIIWQLYRKFMSELVIDEGVNMDININKGKMIQFNLWFAYYDSFFLTAPPRLSHRFYTDHVSVDAGWPISVCPTLAQIYIILESFIKDPTNWHISKCQLEELEGVQQEVDQLMHFVQLEKSYAQSFWGKDPRRIEASTVHFYTFLQLLVRAVIPYPTMNLFECKTAHKLCIRISRLQKLMNQILKCINPMASVLSSARFAQQSKLIKNFFENWIYFMKKLPTIKRNKLNHVHKLARFVCLTNPIEICTINKSIEYAEAIRKKSNTVGTQIEANTYPPSGFFKSYVTPIGNREVLKKRSHSCVSLVLRDCEEGEPFKQAAKKLFNFPPQILQYARQQQNRNKTTTISSLSTLRNKKQSISKFRTLTTDQTNNNSKKKLQMSPLKLKRQKSKTYQKRKDYSSHKRPSNSSSGLDRTVLNRRRETRFYEQETERNEQILSIRSSKESTIRKRQLSVVTIDKNDDGVSYRANKDNVFMENQPKFSILNNEPTKSKWDVVRNFLHEKIKIKKIQRIIKENQITVTQQQTH